MKLNRAIIKNFRSIKDVTVSFEPTCRVLVGINESGKSNVLQALTLLSDEYSPTKKDDLREALPDEDPIEESFVRFVFTLEKEDSDKLFEGVSAKILSSAKNPQIAMDKKPLNLKEFCGQVKEGLYHVDVLKERKQFLYWTMQSYQLLPGWKKISKNCPDDFMVALEENDYILNEYSLVRISDFSDIPDEYLEDAQISDLSHTVGAEVIAVVKSSLPDTPFWEYNEDNLLPASVKIDAFAANPDVCVPLKNMFALANISDIAKSIADAKARGKNQFQNYFDSIAKKTTNHFRDVWKEYKHIEFSLRLDADQIIPGIKEQNVLDFSKRSDGFKRFVTFLLMISVNVQTDSLANTLLLIDEPEISLHPSGARYLRDELIEISKTNYVVYSTHSIFMIDSGDVERHYIVKKKDEITSIEVAKESNIADEEVIYNALGYSAFEILRDKNIIFEGWNDKRLFCVALQGVPAVVRNKYKDYGICHAKGVGTIKSITPIIELARRKCMIISDSDKAAKDQQKIYKHEKRYGDWYTYQDIDGSIEAITGEDFVKNDFIVKQIKAVLSVSAMPSFDPSVLADKGKLNSINRWLTDNGMTAEQAKEALERIKATIFENLKPQHIEEKYNKLLNGIPL